MNGGTHRRNEGERPAEPTLKAERPGPVMPAGDYKRSAGSTGPGLSDFSLYSAVPFFVIPVCVPCFTFRHSGEGRNPVSFAQSSIKTLGPGLRRGDGRCVSDTNFQNELARSRKAQETRWQRDTATPSAEPSTAARRVRVCTACGGL